MVSEPTLRETLARVLLANEIPDHVREEILSIAQAHTEAEVEAFAEELKQRWDESVMSRPIKFRAWDKRDKAWLKKFYVGHDGNLYSERKGDWVVELKKARQQQIELSQNTGLKDCNGKEIYEGDIVERANGKFIVRYWEDGFYLKDPGKEKVFGIKHANSVYGSLGAYTFEIIGNKYENPELLK